MNWAMLDQFTYRGYDVEIEATERESDALGPRVLVSMSIVRARDGDVLFREAPIRMLPAGVTHA
ncbi:putative gp37 [Burkholderia pseudomallei MSHR5613]|nr:putative gp37 [Burkholderia pseudomallei]KGS41399.1 putative gp37 [Burkholderia pseudomallei MSHR5613]